MQPVEGALDPADLLSWQGLISVCSLVPSIGCGVTTRCLSTGMLSGSRERVAPVIWEEKRPGRGRLSRRV